MSQTASAFFIELSSLFNPKGFDEAEKKTKESSNNFSSYFGGLTARGDAWASAFASAARGGSNASASAMKSFFDISSKNFLDLESLAKQTFGGILSSFLSTVTQMAAQSALGGLFGGGGFFSGLLGSRRSGGPIGQTGPYLLHEGEFVLPPEVVSAIKQSRAPANGADFSAPRQAPAEGGGVLNITVNAPVSVQNAAEGLDAKKLCDEIAQAARRGVSWAVEAAKINYKIGAQKSKES